MVSLCSEAAVGLRESARVGLLGQDFGYGQCWERHKVQRRVQNMFKATGWETLRVERGG